MVDNKRKVGLYEAAYYLVSDLLATEYGAEKHATEPIIPTCLDDYIAQVYREELNIIIDKPQLFLVDPFSVSVHDNSLRWGLLSFSPGRTNIIGSIFHLPYSEGLEIELSCGMILSPYYLSMVHGDSSYDITSSKFQFTDGNISNDFNSMPPDSPWIKVFNESHNVYLILASLTNIVHDLLVKDVKRLLDK